MFVKRIVVFFLLFSIFTNVDAKAIDLKNWTTVADIQRSEISIGADIKDNQNIYVLPLNKDVIDLSKKNDLSDIRIIDKDNEEIPYVLIKSNKNIENKDENVVLGNILENKTDKENKTIIVIDTKREGLIYQQIRLISKDSLKNFKKTVKIFVSDTQLKSNSISWKELEQKNVIYNYTDGDFVLENFNIKLLGISSRYIKIELLDENKKNNLNINSVELNYLKDDTDNNLFKIKDYLSGDFVFDNLSIYKDVKLLNKLENDNNLEIIYEGGIDIVGFILKINNNNEINFNNKVIIQGSNDDIYWSDIIEGQIYSINSPIYKGQKLNIEIPPSTYKKIKIIIKDYNNSLSFLKNSTLRLQNTGLLFKYDQDNIYDLKVVVGNNMAILPKYDTLNTINLFSNIKPEIIKYENTHKNPDYIPLRERNKIILNIVLLIFSLTIGIFGFFWIKNDK